MLVFRVGGRLSSSEKWYFQRRILEVVKSYIYLGVKFTPQMSFSEHLRERSENAKMSLYSKWSEFIADPKIRFDAKMDLFKSAIRAIQVYAGQVFGFCRDDEIDKLQRVFLKNLLKLPDSTPTYALYLETNVQPTSIYTMELHMKYILKTLFTYEESRLPNFLFKRII